jgi:hypothetical protein
MNLKTQSKLIVKCYFERSNNPFKAFIDTGTDINLVRNAALNLSNRKTTRKASAIQENGSEIPNLRRTEQKHSGQLKKITEPVSLRRKHST